MKYFLATVLLSGITMAHAQSLTDCLVDASPHSQAYLDCVFYMRPTTITTEEEMAKKGSSIAAYCTTAVGR
jgi:hypothetical protein